MTRHVLWLIVVILSLVLMAPAFIHGYIPLGILFLWTAIWGVWKTTKIERIY